jgi:hypothetical protein
MQVDREHVLCKCRETDRKDRNGGKLGIAAWAWSAGQAKQGECGDEERQCRVRLDWRFARQNTSQPIDVGDPAAECTQRDAGGAERGEPRQYRP